MKTAKVAEKAHAMLYLLSPQNIRPTVDLGDFAPFATFVFNRIPSFFRHSA